VDSQNALWIKEYTHHIENAEKRAIAEAIDSSV
jgi:hypothetical protein